MRLKFNHKKGVTVQNLGALALAVVVVAIIVSMGGEILSQLQETQTSGTYAYNVTGKGLEGMETFGNWIPLIALIVVAAVVIGIIVRYLGGAAGGGA